MKTLLVAIDLTPGSRNALGRAARLAAAAGADLRILHVLSARTFDRDAPEARRAIEAAVGEAIDTLPTPRPGFSFHIAAGDPKQAILDEAREAGADLIVLGAHGASRLRDAIFGTTATHVVRHADRPVLVVQTDPAKPYAKVMLALGHPGQAATLAAVTGTLAPGAELFGVHAFDPPLGRILARREALEREADAREAEIGRILAEAGADPEQVSMRRHAIVEGGDPLTVLMAEAGKLAPDLLAMGTHQRHYLSSYAIDALFWSEHDLLIVPEPSA